MLTRLIVRQSISGTLPSDFGWADLAQNFASSIKAGLLRLRADRPTALYLDIADRGEHGGILGANRA